MDLYSLDEHLQVANLMGHTLNVQERLRISLAIPTLALQHPEVEEFKFWGRLDGTLKSYYILVGYNYQAYQFPRKTFFWAYQWKFRFSKLIDNLYQQHRGPIGSLNGVFTGDATKVILNMEGQEENQQNQPVENQNEDQEKPKEDPQSQNQMAPPKRNLTQINRLSIVVRAIENDCQVVPVGSFKMSPQHSLYRYQLFTGQDTGHNLNLQNWQHFRAPSSESKKIQIEGQHVIFQDDFLDKIQDDLPTGSWSAQTDASKTVVTIRNLVWPGYFAYQKSNSSLFGAAYFGNGRKNMSLAFQL